jgi:hypothetical protein
MNYNVPVYDSLGNQIPPDVASTRGELPPVQKLLERGRKMTPEERAMAEKKRRDARMSSFVRNRPY